MFAFRCMAARSCSLMRMLSFLSFIKFLSLKIKVSLLTFFSKKVSGCRASARRAAERRPAVCDARTLPKGRVQRRHPAVFCLLLRQKRKKGAYTPFTAPYFAFARLGRVFTRFSDCSAHRAFSAAVSAEEEFAVLFLSSAVIYTQWV